MHVTRTAFARNNHGYPWHGICSCGWTSIGYAAEHVVERLVEDHMEVSTCR